MTHDLASAQSEAGLGLLLGFWDKGVPCPMKEETQRRVSVSRHSRNLNGGMS